MNQSRQPALPAYLQRGDRLRKFRVEYCASEYSVYFEKAAAWQNGSVSNGYQQIAGFEFNTVLSRLPGEIKYEVNVGIHRVLDGTLNNKTVLTGVFKVKL